MTQIYICDDEPVWIKQIEQAVCAFLVGSDWEMTILCKASGPEELLECLRASGTMGRIYFLDVGLKSEKNGIELGADIRSLDPDAALIFITTHDELVMDTFRLKLQATDYLLKDQGNLCAQISDTLHALEQRYENAAGRASGSRIRIFTGSAFRFVRKEDIYFIESQKNRHKLFIHMKSEVFTAAVPLKEIAGQLGDGFLPCRRGCLANPRHVVSLNPASREIEFDNREKCICSFRAWRAVLESIT